MAWRNHSSRQRLGKRAIIRIRVRDCTSRHESTAKRDDLLPRIISCDPASGQCDKRLLPEESGPVQLGLRHVLNTNMNTPLLPPCRLDLSWFVLTITCKKRQSTSQRRHLKRMGYGMPTGTGSMSSRASSRLRRSRTTASVQTRSFQSCEFRQSCHGGKYGQTKCRIPHRLHRRGRRCVCALLSSSRASIR